MRHDELRALIHEYFKKALSAQLDRLGAKGPLSELELAPYQTSQALAEASDEDFWGILHPDGTETFLREFCGASGIPQSEAIENPAMVLREYKLAYRDMLKAWEAQRLSLDRYDYGQHGASSLPVSDATGENETAYTLQDAIDEYIHENRRKGT